MNWQFLAGIEDLDSLNSASFGKPQLIFKHSTRCSLSAMAKSRLEASDPNGVPVHFLDLIRFRDISNAIADRYSVVHESPQLLFIHKGECVLEASHLEISSSLIQEETRRLLDQ